MRLFSLLSVLGFLVIPSVCAACDINDKRVQAWADKLRSDTYAPTGAYQPPGKYVQEACSIISSIDQHIRQAQNIISEIASDEVPYREKIGDDGLIERVIQSFFVNGNTRIQVYHSYTQTRQPPDEIPVRTYLQGLADLTYKGFYGSVHLVYDQDNMRLIDITRLDDDDSFEIQVQAFQEFEACKTADGRQCYSDVTDKRFFVRLTDKRSDDPKIKIQRISAIDSWASEYFNNNRSRLMR